MPEQFNLIPNRNKGYSFLGYQSKTDMTALPPGTLVPPSQNVITNDADRVGVRQGYSLYGVAATDLYPISSSYEWITCRGEERPLRFNTNGDLEFAYLGTWYTLKSGLTATAIVQFAEFWNTTEKIDELLFVDGTANLYRWGGAITTIDSVGTNTLTKTGTGTWAASGFLTSLTPRKVTIGGVEYTYTGGESSTTLTGVTPDPALAGPAIAQGDLAFQTVVGVSTGGFTARPSSMSTSQVFDLISSLNNQLYLASTTSRYAWISKQNDYLTYTSSSPRAPGEGDTLTLDGSIVGFAPETNESDQNGSLMFISAGKDFWYRVSYQLSSDLTKETAQIKRLASAPREAAISQGAIAKIKNKTVYISNEPTLDELGRVESIDTTQTKPISDPIKTDFESYDFTNAHIKYWRQYICVALPNESILLMYNIQKQYWEAPQVLPIGRLAIIGGDLYGHSNAVPETYHLFDGSYNDNSNPIDAIAAFAYENSGRRDAQKSEDAHYTEGYISSNTALTCVLKYDFGGFTSIVEETIDGADDDIIFSTSVDGSIGKNPIGEQPIGGITDSISNTPKFRVIHDLVKQNYYERQVQYSSNDVDQQWEILAYGSNATLSPDNQFAIRK
jgi:hypothetical protein